MQDRLPPRALVGASAVLALIGVLVLLAVRSGGGRVVSVTALRLVDGVPVGVRDTPAGALAAADEYVTLSSQTVEQSPARFAALVAQAYAPSLREQALREAAGLRSTDVLNMANYRAGGGGFAFVAARRLDSFTPGEATVASWLGGVVWGPGVAPRQSWNLVDTKLVWRAGRWLVTNSHMDGTPAPVPAVVYVHAGNDRSGAFSRVTGMSPPSYGAEE